MNYDLGYIAGLIDAEGSIFISKHMFGGKAYFYPRISVSNTNLQILHFLEQIGGKARIQPMDSKFGSKQVWVWALQQQHAILSLLENISPYLIVKRGNAVAVLGHDVVSVLPSWSYIAGVLDGDGSVTVTRNNYKYWRVDVRLVTVCEELALALVEKCGGNFCIRQPAGISKKIQFLWQSYRQRRNRVILENILPYAIEKRAAVERALTCLASLSGWRKYA